MVDQPLSSWAKSLLDQEYNAFEDARQRFTRKPSPGRLHKVRTAARRLRSLLDDIATIVDTTAIRASIKPLIKSTGKARDATVIAQILRDSADAGERQTLKCILRELNHIERRCRHKACKRAEHATT